MAMAKLIIHSPKLSETQLAHLSDYGHNIEHRGAFFCCHEAREAPIEHWRQQWQMDINRLHPQWQANQTKLVISDMDSTLINIECIDELADSVGLKESVAAITARAMSDETFDFSQSLKQRVSLLKGLPVSALETVYQNKLRLNPGALELLIFLAKNKIHFALVSGGFTYFTEKLKSRFQFQFAHSNQLEIADRHLTGQVVGPIVDGLAKQQYLIKLCSKLGIEPHQVIALGDGSNDLPMMQTAGLSVAYQAKKTVREQAQWQINHTGLDSVIAALTV